VEGTLSGAEMKYLYRNILIIIFVMLFGGTSYAQCHDDVITSPSPFMGNNDEIFKLSSGEIWQIKYEYEYLYEYSPSVVICPSLGMLIIQGKRLQIAKLSSGAQSSPSSRQGLIESQIDGEFRGWEGETIYKLMNGQIWQQASYSYSYSYSYMPSVMIYQKGSSYFMQVKGERKSIAVRQLR
jgi:hypothetical protein